MRFSIFTILIFTFVTINSKGFSQQLCLEIDSIVISYIPLNISTRLSLSEIDVLNLEEHLISKTVRDSQALSIFSSINLNNSDLLKNPVDVRLVLDIYLENYTSIRFLMDKNWNFSDHNDRRFNSDSLSSWISDLNLIGVSYNID